ncbi:MAG: BrnT family toxin [Gammaproteobacteria bacterium]
MPKGTHSGRLQGMVLFNWSLEKNQELIATRGVSFEDAVFLIKEGKVLDEFPHPNQKKYPDQRVFVLSIAGYVYLVPFVENDDEIFLKTIIPSRKATRQYLGEKL